MPIHAVRSLIVPSAGASTRLVELKQGTKTSAHASSRTRPSRSRLGPLPGEPTMKILLTGSRGYIGAVMAPMMVRAGHDVTGLDADLYRRSTFGAWRDPIHTIEKDVRAVEAGDLEGFEA